MTLGRLLAVRWFLPALVLLAGCSNWPLYLNLPDPVPPTVEPVSLSVVEDDALLPSEVQDLGSVAVPAELTLTGTAEACGFDLDRDVYPWPEQPLDTDGDGEIDTTAPAHQGWYATDADVDLFGLRAGAEAWMAVELTWTNAPPLGGNAPYRPDDADGEWADETDLDLLVLDWSGDAPVRIASDAGFTLDHPEVTPQWLGLGVGEQVAFAVGCHHGQPSDYEIRITLQAP